MSRCCPRVLSWICAECGRKICLTHALLKNASDQQDNRLVCYPACVDGRRVAEILASMRGTFAEVAPLAAYANPFSLLIGDRWLLHAKNLDEELAAEEALRMHVAPDAEISLADWLDDSKRSVNEVLEALGQAAKRSKNQAGA